MTEASHLRTLRVLDLIFYQRMKKENLMPREELARLFPNLPELIEIHSEGPSSPPAVPPAHPFSGRPWVSLPVLPRARASLSRRPSPALWQTAPYAPCSQPSRGPLPAAPLSPAHTGPGGAALPLASLILLSVPQIPGVRP